MKNYKLLLYITLVNFCMSLFVSYISPRFDIITFIAFIVTNSILFFLLLVNKKNREKNIKRTIDDIFLLLQSLDTDSNNYEVMDDEFGKLKDEIVKIMVEHKSIADEATKNGQILREYTEDIAHQIKTPLTGILLILDLMQEDKENSEEYIKRLRSDIVRLHQLVEILLKFATLDSGITQMKKEKVYIKGMIEDIIENMELYFNNENFKIPIHGDDFILNCDKRWTYEAIFNIVKNGMEASENFIIKIYLKETNLFKSVIVEDFSQGIHGEELKKVYKRFYKSNPNSKGYGIGLPMAKSIMEKQNGELIYVKGKSSNTFELRFYK